MPQQELLMRLSLSPSYTGSGCTMEWRHPGSAVCRGCLLFILAACVAAVLYNYCVSSIKSRVMYSTKCQDTMV